MRAGFGIVAAAAILLAGCGAAGASSGAHRSASSGAPHPRPAIHGTLVRGGSCVPSGRANVYC